MGSFLQHAAHMGTVALCPLIACAPGLRVHIQALQADVRQHRHRDRQCQSGALGALGPLPGKALSATVRSRAHAGTRNPPLPKFGSDRQLAVYSGFIRFGLAGALSVALAFAAGPFIVAMHAAAAHTLVKAPMSPARRNNSQ